MLTPNALNASVWFPRGFLLQHLSYYKCYWCFDIGVLVWEWELCALKKKKRKKKRNNDGKFDIRSFCFRRGDWEPYFFLCWYFGMTGWCVPCGDMLDPSVMDGSVCSHSVVWQIHFDVAVSMISVVSHEGKLCKIDAPLVCSVCAYDLGVFIKKNFLHLSRSNEVQKWDSLDSVGFPIKKSSYRVFLFV